MEETRLRFVVTLDANYTIANMQRHHREELRRRLERMAQACCDPPPGAVSGVSVRCKVQEVRIVTPGQVLLIDPGAN